MLLPLVPVALMVLVILGNGVQLIFDRDDWPLSNYSMYAHLVADHARNPFVPVRPEHESEAGVLVLVAQLADGTAVPLTTRYAHPLLMPYERLRIIRHLTTLYRRRADVGPAMTNLAAWVRHRSQEIAYDRPIRGLSLELYLWHRLPDRPEKNHPPDRVLRIADVELGP